jgi:hypothetical protein
LPTFWTESIAKTRAVSTARWSSSVHSNVLRLVLKAEFPLGRSGDDAGSVSRPATTPSLLRDR